MIHRIGLGIAPALGDLRAAGPGDTILFLHDARQRPDWPRYWQAAATAVFRGAALTVVTA
ncbi:hypothetical protein OG455_38995 [Kitasatospora sp. NBC_01287]|uniref:hypothetical protein n=1 Tax=Kitasatospora sp. NBC_01287 TaxID=2903573 RepID=UPI0022598E2A|nr:hypothetical protein [Kitasatospora sp. NBC_01287]MCX4751423.1 hypothetical protein [Kitasatospora sp. NBC_01287]